MSLAKLLSIASPSLASASASDLEVNLTAGHLSEQLHEMLRQRNGFFAFENALHVFPCTSSSVSMDLQQWNAAELWRNEYQDLTDGCVFFAEDVFGGQFCLYEQAIHTFDPETGQRKPLAKSIEGWAAAILENYRVLTAHPLAHDWQERNGVIPAFKRLSPKMPFVCGGSYTLDNLYLADSVEAMRFRGYLATQIRDLPEGASIRFKVVP